MNARRGHSQDSNKGLSGRYIMSSKCRIYVQKDQHRTQKYIMVCQHQETIIFIMYCIQMSFLLLKLTRTCFAHFYNG